MSRLYDQLSSEIIDTLKGYGKVLTMFDVNGKKTYETSKARRVFCQPDKMMFIFDEDGENSIVKMNLSDTSSLEDMQKLISTIRSIATRYNVLFNVQKYGKTLAPVDFAYESIPVSESVIADQKVISKVTNIFKQMKLREGIDFQINGDKLKSSNFFLNIATQIGGLDCFPSVPKEQGEKMFTVIVPFKVDVDTDGEIQSWIAAPGDIISDENGIYTISRDGNAAIIANTDVSSADEKIEKMISKGVVEKYVDMENMPTQPHIMVRFESDGDDVIAKDLIQQFDSLDLYSNKVTDGIREMIFVIPTDSFLTIDDYMDEFEIVMNSYDKSAEIEAMGSPEEVILDESTDFAEGDMVATDYGPGTVRKVNGRKIRVELVNGKIVTVHKEDIKPAGGNLYESEDDDYKEEKAVQRAVDEFTPEHFASHQLLDRIISKYKGKDRKFDLDLRELRNNAIDYLVDVAQSYDDDLYVPRYYADDRVDEILPSIIDYLENNSIMINESFGNDIPLWMQDEEAKAEERADEAFDEIVNGFDPKECIQGTGLEDVLDNAEYEKTHPGFFGQEDYTVSEDEIANAILSSLKYQLEHEYNIPYAKGDFDKVLPKFVREVSDFLKQNGVKIGVAETILRRNAQKSFRDESAPKNTKKVSERMRESRRYHRRVVEASRDSAEDYDRIVTWSVNNCLKNEASFIRKLEYNSNYFESMEEGLDFVRDEIASNIRRLFRQEQIDNTGMSLDELADDVMHEIDFDTDINFRDIIKRSLARKEEELESQYRIGTIDESRRRRFRRM